VTDDFYEDVGGVFNGVANILACVVGTMLRGEYLLY
jgi:hypothetical protein